MIELKDVSKYYHNDGITNKGLINIDLKLSRDEIVVITGESGSGKSTLLNVITKQDTFDDGEIYYLGNETSYFSVDDMDYFRKNKIGFIFQNYNIIDSYTVLENVMLPLIINDVPYKEAKKEAMEIIRKVGLEKWAKNRGTKLSGGQKQRCVIARALASRCEILACDEPTGNLDSETGREIVDLIKEVAPGKLVLIVTHNYEQFQEIATRKIKVHDGEIIEDTYIEKKAEDENKDLELDYVPVSIKTDFRIAANNLKSTPKKTILMCLITLFTAFFAYFLYQTTFEAAKNLYHNNTFIYQGSEKVVAYNKDHSALDTTKLKANEYYTNLFYETASFRVYEDGFFSLGGGFDPSSDFSSIKVVEGRLPQNDKELIFVLPKNYWSGCEYYVGKEVRFNSVTVDDARYDMKIVGIAKSSKVGDDCFMTSKNDKTTKDVFKFAYMAEKIGANVNINRSRTTAVYNKLGYPSIVNYTYFDNVVMDAEGTTSKAIPNKVSAKDYTYIEIGSDYESNYETVYEASLYGNKKAIKKNLSKNKISYIDISKFDSATAAERFLNNIISYISIVSESITVLLVYLVASVILSKVFTSKLETYAIFRTLGITKRDMKKVLYYEVYIIVGAITVVNYIICIMIGKLFNIKYISNLFSHVSLTVSIVYFLVMALIAWLLAKKFNKKLFRNSVRETLKEEK